MKIACPHCHGNIEVGPDWLGQQAACPHCSENFLVPNVPSSSEASEAPTPAYTDLAPRGNLRTPVVPRRAFAIGGGILLLLAIAVAVITNGMGLFGSNTLRRGDDGKWDLQRFSNRPEEERIYIAQLIEIWDSLRDVRWSWTNLERMSTFPYGEYWQGMNADRAQAALRGMQYSAADIGGEVKGLVNSYNELQRVSEPLLAARPDLAEPHDALRLSADLEYEVTNPQVAYEFESLAGAIEAMFEALGITVPKPKTPGP